MKNVIEVLLVTLLLLKCNMTLAWDHPKPANVGQFPHQLSLQWGSPEIALGHSCGGVILSELWLASSGYCVSHISTMNTHAIKAGFHNIDEEDEHVQVVQIQKIVVHEKYRGIDVIASYVAYDLGLIKVTPAFVFNDRVKPINLPRKSGVLKNKFKLEYNLILSGWAALSVGILEGQPKVLQTVHLPIVPGKVCQQSIRTIIPNFSLADSQMCTRPLDGSVSGCIGDYGGPLIQYNQENEPVLVGIMGWCIIPCDTNGLAPVYARIPHFYKWIKRKMKEE